jgi:DNA segregation ATPase FtsK/SpoIIIE, S-DNA-T family
MARKKKQQRGRRRDDASDDEETGGLKISEGTIRGILAIVFFVLFVFFLMAYFNLAGVVGERFFTFFDYLLGVGYFLLPLVTLLVGMSLYKTLRPDFAPLKIASVIFLFISSLGTVNILTGGHNLLEGGKGGFLGNIISSPLVSLFDFYVSLLLLLAIVSISFLVLFETEIRVETFLKFISRPFHKKREANQNGDRSLNGKNGEEENGVLTSESKKALEEEKKEPEAHGKTDFKKILTFGNSTDVSGVDLSASRSLLHSFRQKYTPPPISLLEKDKGKPGVGDIKANANIIKRTLQNFGISVEMDEISVGPTVTRYALKPAEGIKLARIVGLQNDLSLALAAHPIRIEAPIPGKSLVGIEIPNSSKTTVGLSALLSQKEFLTSPKPLMVCLGRGISGTSHFINLAKIPHLLVAGATGSGKSVTIHALIASLLYRNSPQNLKFIMIDPKRVELTMYNDIPHLLTPVIKNAKDTILSLRWAAKEMERRYDVLESHKVRDVQSYHTNILEPKIKKLEKNTKPEEDADLPETMPYIVIIIDELADIMSTYPRELESAVVRLAQMSRAVGIHLILSTQRPSVNIITGLIKANVPGRIALQVSSQIDSRTILDSGGAEKLLGAGDMLYISGEMSQPVRIQSAFISEDEVKKIVSHLKDSYSGELQEEIVLSGPGVQDKNVIFESTLDDEGFSDGEDDELYEDARQLVVEAGKASTSYLQRRLRLGYARAARLMDILEENGVIGPPDGSKPREILIKDKDNQGEENDTNF